MKDQIINYIKDHIVGFIITLSLCALVLLFSEQIHQYIGIKKSKTEFQHVDPVDYTKDEDIMSCLKNRVPENIITTCQEAFQQ